MSSPRGAMFFFLDRDRVKGVWRWLAWALCALVGITFSIEAAPVAAGTPAKPATGESNKPSKVSSRSDETSAAISARAQGSPVEVVNNAKSVAINGPFFPGYSHMQRK